MERFTGEPRRLQWTRDAYEQITALDWFERQNAELKDGEIFVQAESQGRAQRRWTYDEYFQLFDLGLFGERRVELIGGEVIEMPAQHNIHAAGIALTETALCAAFGAGYWVRNQATLNLSPHGAPDPDLAVVPGSPRQWSVNNPTTALLVVEVSDTTLGYDRNAKASLYAASGIADYWIVNLVQGQVEVYRDPVADTAQPFGCRYGQRTILDPGDHVAPLAAPQASVAVDDLLP